MRSAWQWPGRHGLGVGCVDEQGGPIEGPFRRDAAGVEERGVADRCKFVVADIRDLVRADADRSWDVAMLLTLGPIFGDAGETVAVLRQLVMPGGLILIDDAYLDDAYLDDGLDPRDAQAQEMAESLEHCFDRARTILLLEAHGDRVIAERIYDNDEYRDWLRAMTAKILARARQLAPAHPRDADALLAFAERQRDLTEQLCGPLVGVLWLIEVGG